MNPQNPYDPNQPAPMPQPQAAYPQPSQPYQQAAAPVAPQPTAQQPQYGSTPLPAPRNEADATSGRNPYEFIVASNQAQPTGMFSFGGSKAMKALVLVLVGAALLGIVAIAVTALRPKDSAQQLYVTLVQDQQEIVRIAKLGNLATTEATKSFSTNTQLSVSSDQRELLGYLSSKGVSVDSKVIVLKQDSTTDKTLSGAKSTNTYDTALTQALITELKSYGTDISAASKQTSGATTKKMLGEDYNNVQLLLKQAGAETATKP